MSRPNPPYGIAADDVRELARCGLVYDEARGQWLHTEDDPFMTEADWQHHVDHHSPAGHPETCAACEREEARK